MHRSRFALLLCLVGLSGCATGALGSQAGGVSAGRVSPVLMGSASDTWTAPETQGELRAHLPIAAPAAPFALGRTTGADLRTAFEQYGFPLVAETPKPASLDPLGDAFVGNWEKEHLPKDRFMPLTGSLDLDVFRSGAIYGRAWGLDQDLRGIGVGVAWRLGDAWQLAAEIGVDPFSSLEEGRFAILMGMSRKL